MIEAPSRQGTAAMPDSSTCCNLVRSMPTQGPAPLHNALRSVVQRTSPCSSQKSHRRTTAPACSIAAPRPSACSTRMPFACTRKPAPAACQVGLRSTSSTMKPCWWRAAARVSPAIPPPTIKVRSTSAIANFLRHVCRRENSQCGKNTPVDRSTKSRAFATWMTEARIRLRIIVLQRTNSAHLHRLRRATSSGVCSGHKGYGSYRRHR